MQLRGPHANPQLREQGLIESFPMGNPCLSMWPPIVLHKPHHLAQSSYHHSSATSTSY
ncbi:hypothetical protein QJS10_CPB11g01961 [Acorus calamus]|uniref:Uncharacterized protein n=1 Tax=Acorus calamus TaxID=4465 RepID=A0AAV9DQI6_ACOCL|nr:hypothetical protein QJS10_CPB11g01961 [Acorus calamus]